MKTRNKTSSAKLRTQFVGTLKVYIETTPESPEPEDAGGPGVGALKTALKRSVRYNKKDTRITAPKAAQ
jgi:hypothetical protein